MLIALKRFLLFYLVWLMLTGAAAGGLAFGAAAAAASAWLSLRLTPPAGAGVSLFALARMFPAFVRRSILGGIDVAYRALHPRMPLKAGWIVAPTTLPEGGARVALGGEFSLLPGTLAAGTRGNDILVHCLDTDQDVLDALRREERAIAAAIGRDEPRERETPESETP